MKKKHSLLLLIVLETLSLFIFCNSFFTFFGVEFDARDNMWPFLRYYIEIYPDIILFLFLIFVALLITIFLKNTINQNYGRSVVIFMNYILKFMFLVTFVTSLSAIQAVSYLNNFGAFLSLSILNILASFILLLTISGTLINEIIFISKNKVRNSN